jgi:protein-S-isoprenylcysteine O-methyltransferase Ste14
MSRLRSALPHLAADAALAAVVVLVGQLEVWAPSVMHPGNLAGPRWIIAAGYLAVGVLVAVRRVWLRRRHAGAGLRGVRADP